MWEISYSNKLIEFDKPFSIYQSDTETIPFRIHLSDKPAVKRIRATFHLASRPNNRRRGDKRVEKIQLLFSFAIPPASAAGGDGFMFPVDGAGYFLKVCGWSQASCRLLLFPFFLGSFKYPETVLWHVLQIAVCEEKIPKMFRHLWICHLPLHHATFGLGVLIQ